MFPLPHFVIITYLIASSLSDEMLSNQMLIVVQEPNIDWSDQSHEECGIKYSASENYEVIKYEGIVNISLPTHIISAPKYLVIKVDNNLIFASHSNRHLVQTYKTKNGGWLASFKPGDAHEQYFVCDDVSDEKCDSFFPKSGDNNYRDFSGEISVTFPIAAGSKNRTHALNTHSFIRNESSADYHYFKLGPSFGQTLYHFQVNESLIFVTKESINGSVSMIIRRSDGAKDGVSKNDYVDVDPISIYYQQSTNKLYVIMRSENSPNYSIGWIDPFENSDRRLQDIQIIENFACDFDQFMVIDGATLIFRSASEIIAVKKNKIMKLFSASNNLASDQNISPAYLIPTSYSNEDSIIIYSNGIFYSIHSVQNDVSIIFVIGLASLLILMIAIVILLAIFLRKRSRNEDEEQLIGDSYIASEEVDENVPEAEITPWADQLEPASGIRLIDDEDDEDANIEDAEVEDEKNVDAKNGDAKNGYTNIGDANVEDANIEEAEVEVDQEILTKEEPSVDHVHETMIEPIVIVQSAGIEFDSGGMKDGASGKDAKLETEVEEMSPSIEKHLNPYIPDILANISNDQVTRLAFNEDIQEEAMVVEREESNNNQEEESSTYDKHETKAEKSIVEKEEGPEIDEEKGEETIDTEKNEQPSSPNVEEDEDEGGSVYEEANEEEAIREETIQGGTDEEDAYEGANLGGATEMKEEGSWEPSDNLSKKLTTPLESLVEETGLINPLEGDADSESQIRGNIIPEIVITENIIPEIVITENIIPEIVITEIENTENSIDSESGDSKNDKNDHAQEKDAMEEKKVNAEEEVHVKEEIDVKEEVDVKEEPEDGAASIPEDGAASMPEAGKKKKNRRGKKKRKQIVS